jgi:predicted kinase
MGSTPALYLLHGFAGAGKTTYAKKLAEETGAVRFTADEWMARLYGTNPPADKFQEYHSAIDSLIWEAAGDLLRRGSDVILDDGFWSRHKRDLARKLAARWNAVVQVIHVSCPESVMRARVAKRSSELPPGALFIDEKAFEFFKSRFEPLGADEPHRRIETAESEPR